MPLKILHGSKKCLPSMKALWRDTFCDSDEFIDLFFSEFYKPRKAFLRFDGDELVSMLFYMDLKVKFDGRRFKTAYLYGVATKLSERRQGHFTALHNALLEELKAKKYDLVVTIPQNDSLFSFYKDIGYTLPLRRCEYELETLDVERADDLSQVWAKKKELHKKSRQAMSILESESQFIESRREHRFFSYDDGYLGFYPTKDSFRLYDIISDDPLHAPVKLVHYERSALIMDLTKRLDPERIEKEKPVLSFLLN
ncbi:MAG: GNAT family N-acetyltransferase [Clostridia bacterium]|nr:GNAT family N-acetyltransferase [Clostridia bacterium]